MSAAAIVAVTLVILGSVGWLFAMMKMRWGLALLVALAISAVMLIAGMAAGPWTYLAVLLPLAGLVWDARRTGEQPHVGAPRAELIRQPVCGCWICRPDGKAGS